MKTKIMIVASACLPGQRFHPAVLPQPICGADEQRCKSRAEEQQG